VYHGFVLPSVVDRDTGVADGDICIDRVIKVLQRIDLTGSVGFDMVDDIIGRS